MAKGRLLEYVDVEDGEAAEPEGSDEQRAFEEWVSSLSHEDGVGTLRVSRVPTTGKSHPMHTRTVWCFACPIDQYDFDGLCGYIADHYGGGIYRLVAVIKGKRGAAFNRLIEIADVPKGEGAPAVAGEVPRHDGLGAVIDSLGSLIMQSQERTEAMLARLPQAQAADPFTMMERTLGMLGQLGVVGGTRERTDVLGELERLAKLKEVASTFAGDGGAPGATFYDFAGKMVEALGPAFRALPQLQQQQAPVPPDSHAMGTRIEPPMATPVPADPPSEASSMKSQVEALVRNAAKGVDAEHMAQVVYGMTPDERLPELAVFVRDPGCVDRMQAACDDVALYRAWFDALRAALVRELDGNSEDSAGDYVKNDLHGEEGATTLDPAHDPPEAPAASEHAGGNSTPRDS